MLGFLYKVCKTRKADDDVAKGRKFVVDII